MELTVLRLADNGNATFGAFYIDGIFECFTVEDEERKVKVKGETRVPDGTYEVTLRAEGGYHNKYTDKYPDIHKGMLAIHNRDNYIIEADGMSFQYILIHTGNHEGHTNGCLLLNDNMDGETFKGSSSVDAYKDAYPKIAAALESGDCVTITYKDVEPGR